MTEPVAVEASAEVRAIKSMVDHSVNVTLNFPEDCKEQALQFLRWQGLMVKIVAVIEG